MMRPRTCPTHRAPMQRLITATAAGKELEIDRCGECGSLWFDAGELQMLASHRALPAGPGFEHFCPSCSDPSRDPAVGGTFSAARCTRCDGTFLDGPTVARLHGERLPQPPDASARSQELGFLCAKCEGRFPYSQGNAIAHGLVCRSCLKGAVGSPTATGLEGVFDAVMRFLS